MVKVARRGKSENASKWRKTDQHCNAIACSICLGVWCVSLSCVQMRIGERNEEMKEEIDNGETTKTTHYTLLHCCYCQYMLYNTYMSLRHKNTETVKVASSEGVEKKG